MSLEQQKVTREWDAMAGEWDDLASGYRDWFLQQLWKETNYVTPEARANLVVFDFGCGTGLLVEKLRQQVAKVVAMDVAPTMIQYLNDKKRAGDWNNVDVYCAVAAHLDQAPSDVGTALEELKGKVDIVACSSVLSFVPENDREATLQVLASLLKPHTGTLIHTDWPMSESHPDGMTEESAKKMYQKGGLQAQTTKVMSQVKLGGDHVGDVFVGVASRI